MDPAPHTGIISEPGLGKTSIILEEIRDFIADQRAAMLPHRAVVAVPVQILSSEAAQRAIALGLSVAVWHGREADDPKAPGCKMCSDLDAVRNVAMVKGDIDGKVCGTMDGKHCAFYETCSYQRQRAEAMKADVLFVASTVLFGPLPTAARKNVGMYVADEPIWHYGYEVRRVYLEGFANEVKQWPVLRDPNRQDGDDEDMHTGGFGDPDVDPGNAATQATPEQVTEELYELCLKLEAAGRATKDNEPISAATLRDHGLIAEDRAVALEWARKVEPAIYPGMPAEERAAMCAQVAGNASITARASLWKAVREVLSDPYQGGRVRMETLISKTGNRRVFVAHRRESILETVTTKPILMLDGTMPVEINKLFLPRLMVHPPIRVIAEHQTVAQIIGKGGKGGWGKSRLTRDSAFVDEIVDYVALRCRGNALVITYKDIEERFKAIPGVQTLHFGNLVGVDKYKDVAVLFVIGRPMARDRDVHEIATALTGRVIERQKPTLVDRGARMPDGTGRRIKVWAYADRDLEMVHAAISSEVEQAIGRARGINRTADNPLMVFLMADIVTPYTVHDIGNWEQQRPGMFGTMLRHGAVLFAPADVVGAYAAVFGTKAADGTLVIPKVDSVKKALVRERTRLAGWEVPWEDFAEDYARQMATLTGWPLVLVRYQPQGERQRPRVAVVRNARMVGLKVWLAGVVGPLVQCEEIARFGPGGGATRGA